MAKLVEQKTYALILDQDELNILYRTLIDSAYSSDELVYNLAETVVDGVDNLESDTYLDQENEDDEDVDMPF